ncbi:helix-turn-helix transcriptional regulator [Caulobacter sp. 17J80-11]|uniref:helix-turn-helix transcriptional regulator n=1 Tax=Caulobacter sp. 17J80-11 TaxID=2763502 RepID=UPI0021079F83|nr:helix-turn-helix transcriptional regulator [Caulobacter sp. 17J80-11]
MAFHRAVREEAAVLVARHGAFGAFEEARRRRQGAEPGDLQLFAYNVERATAEIAGISLDNPKARPLGPEPPVWFLPFLSEARLARLTELFEALTRRWGMASAPEADRLKVEFSAKFPTAGLLTPRQAECLRWAAEGKSSWDIAQITGLSPRTVDEHLDNACRRLGVKRRAQAVAAATRAGIL